MTCRPTACADVFRFSDPYHSCYVLAGLSVAQHRFEGTGSAEPASSSVDWSITPLQSSDQVFLETDRVGTLHPAFAIPMDAVEQTQQYFRAKQSF
jgi:protein farnesyltransferase subunit beta